MKLWELINSVQDEILNASEQTQDLNKTLGLKNKFYENLNNAKVIIKIYNTNKNLVYTGELFDEIKDDGLKHKNVLHYKFNLATKTLAVVYQPRNKKEMLKKYIKQVEHKGFRRGYKAGRLDADGVGVGLPLPVNNIAYVDELNSAYASHMLKLRHQAPPKKYFKPYGECMPRIYKTYKIYYGSKLYKILEHGNIDAERYTVKKLRKGFINNILNWYGVVLRAIYLQLAIGFTYLKYMFVGEFMFDYVDEKLDNLYIKKESTLKRLYYLGVIIGHKFTT